MLTPEQLNEIEERANAAARGPYVPEWDSCDCGDGYPCRHGSYVYALRLPEPRTSNGEPQSYHFLYSEIVEFTPATARFLAAAREDIPALLTEVKRLRTALENMTNSRDMWRSEAEDAAAVVKELGELISAAHHDLRIAVGDGYSTVNSAAFEAARQIAELTADRDRAREIAVALEQGVARLTEELGQARLDEQYDAMATAGAFDEEEL